MIVLLVMRGWKGPLKIIESNLPEKKFCWLKYLNVIKI